MDFWNPVTDDIIFNFFAKKLALFTQIKKAKLDHNIPF
jgi:hypothetical protein